MLVCTRPPSRGIPAWPVPPYASPSRQPTCEGERKQNIIFFNDKNKKRMTKTLDEFLIDVIKIHGDKYDYSLVEYKGTDNKIKIICNEHGIFNQKCSKHLQNQGCPICKESKLEKEISILESSDLSTKEIRLKHVRNLRDSLVSKINSYTKIEFFKGVLKPKKQCVMQR